MEEARHEREQRGAAARIALDGARLVLEGARLAQSAAAQATRGCFEVSAHCQG